MLFRIIWAFIKRDFLIEKSYRLAFFIELVSIFFAAAGFFLVGKMIGGEGANVLSKYKGNYISFVIIGLAFSGYMVSGLYAFSSAINREQIYGTFEKLFLISSAPEWLLVLLLGSYTFISGTLRIFVYLIFGYVFFDVDFSNMNLSSALLTSFLCIITYAGLGAFSAGFTILYKRGNPLDFLLIGLMTFFGGIYFPVDLIPDFLRWLSNLIPITHSLYALRMSLLNGYDIFQLKKPLIILFCFSVICLSSGILFLKIAVKQARLAGGIGTQ